jgi:hypothetical protein
MSGEHHDGDARETEPAGGDAADGRAGLGHDHGAGDDDDHGSGAGDDGHGHGHDHAAAYDTDTWWGQVKAWLAEWYHGLYHSMVEAPAMENVEMAAEDAEDAFLFACFADAFGIPSPVSYYTVELLPYLAEEFEQFERRMWDRESLLERKGEQYHVH